MGARTCPYCGKLAVWPGKTPGLAWCAACRSLIEAQPNEGTAICRRRLLKIGVGATKTLILGIVANKLTQYVHPRKFLISLMPGKAAAPRAVLRQSVIELVTCSAHPILTVRLSTAKKSTERALVGCANRPNGIGGDGGLEAVVLPNTSQLFMDARQQAGPEPGALASIRLQ
jgi:hypothetical protein